MAHGYRISICVFSISGLFGMDVAWTSTRDDEHNVAKLSRLYVINHGYVMEVEPWKNFRGRKYYL